MATPAESSPNGHHNGLALVPLHGVWIEEGKRVCACSRRSECTAAGKHPIPRAWTREASTDRRDWDRWATIHYQPNWGVVGGEKSGDLVVIDVDNRHGGDKTLIELERQWGDLPKNTRRVRTGGGGEHYYFRSPGVGSRNDWRQGIDIKANGGQVVAPPSLHISGRHYTWVDENAPILDLPEAWRVHMPKIERAAEIDWDGEEPRVQYGAGERNAGLTKEAGRLRKAGYNVRQIRDMLDVLNQTMCTPPLDDQEIDETMMKSVGRWAPGIVIDEDNGIVGAWQDRFVDGASFVRNQSQKIPAIWGVGDDVLWASGESFMIVGPPGVGKTTIAHQIIMSRIGIGGDVLGYPVAPTSSKVLYLACDRPPQIARALARLVGEEHDEILRDKLVVWKGPPVADFAQNTNLLVEMCEAAGADTVVVDSLKDVALKLSADEVGAGYNNARQKATSAGVEVLELHHQVKRGGGDSNRPDELADVYGSAWITAGAGSVVLLWGAAGDPVVELKHLKQPASQVESIRVVHNHEAGTSMILPGGSIMDVIMARPGKWTLSELAIAVHGESSNTSAKENARQKTKRALRKFVASGVITEEDTGAAGASRYLYSCPIQGLLPESEAREAS